MESNPLAESCHAAKDFGSIVCSTCGNTITNAVSLRCPRCFAPLIKAGECSGNCGKCGRENL